MNVSSYVQYLICFLAMASSSSSHHQVAEAKTGGEASGAAGGSGAIPQVGAGGAARATHEGPAVRSQRNRAIQVH